MDSPFLRLRIVKSYPNFRLELDCSLESRAVALFGPSGSGKSTTLNCIAGLTLPDEGEILLEGQLLFSSAHGVNLAPEKRRVGYVFQDALLFPHLTVRDNILYGFKLTPPGERKIDPHHLIELLKLGPFLDRKPTGLSGGECQRVALARALATSPRLLLLDEPLASLDFGLRGRILLYLKRLRAELSIPMIYVSHSISEVAAIADRVLVLFQGRQVAYDEPHRVLCQPGVYPLAQASGIENFLEGRVVSHEPLNGLTQIRVGQATLRVPQVERAQGESLMLVIRAVDIILSPEAPSRLSTRNTVRGRIEALHVTGPRVLVYTDVGQRLIAEITPEALRELELKEGQDVYLIIKSSSILVL